MHLVCAFHESFLFPHFKFLQLADEEGSGTPSFQARHLTVRYFLMMEDLKDIKEKWRTNEYFNDYGNSLALLSATDKQKQQQKFTYFFRYVSESLTIHFKQWTEHLLFLALFSNQKTAAPVANILLGRSDETCCEIYDKNHN